MDFVAVIEQAKALLQTKGRVTYRVLKRQFALDDEALDDLKEQLIDADRVAVEEDGRILVWVGDGAVTSAPLAPVSQPRTPASYTPEHLAERILAEQAAMESRGSSSGERKTITALFADLKGSTALIEGLDPEEARALIDPALQLMMDAVYRYDGYVAQALGDGIFALFGAPLAHEDHPQRAALRMQEAMRGYADTLREQGRPPLMMRVGLNTGEVVVRAIRKDDLHADYVPIGHSTNLAARMEQLAAPGSIVVTDYTYKLTDGYFEFKDLGKTQIKGAEAPLNVYEVLGAEPLRTRLQVSARRGLTRFVGRQRELDHMQQALDQAKAGHGQIVGVTGEPGLGKSRLFYEFKSASQSGCLALEAFSIPHGKASPYLPIIELLKSYFQIEPSDDERTRRAKVRGHVLALDKSLEDTLPYLLVLLGIDDPAASLPQMDAQIRRQRTFNALKKLLLRESLNQPLLLVFEDLHWIDSETQGFLDSLSESVASAKLLLLVNYRPEYRHAWGTKTYYTQLRLTPLGKAEAEELLTFLLGSDASLRRLKALILERTEGTPFFMEEVVQTLAEEGTLHGARGSYHVEKTPTELHISPTVQGVLAARIDRLTTEEKALLQQLAVIGRQFPVRLVKEIVSQSEADLYRVLSSLQAKEFLYEQPAFPEVEYLFKHALTQEVAYGTVLQEQRKALHERTGQAMEALYKATLEDHYSELAYHYTQSANVEKAVAYLGLAGHQAVQRSSYDEAIGHLTAAVELLHTLPDAPERDRQELRLLITLGTPLNVTKGFGAPGSERVFTRALTLGQQLGGPALLFPVLFGLWMVRGMGGEYAQAQALGEQCFTLATQADDSTLLLEARYVLTWPLLAQGEFVRAREQAEQGRAIYDVRRHGRLSLTYLGVDPGVACLLAQSLALWFLGYPDQARQRQHQCLALAREVAYPNVQAYAYQSSNWLYQLLREVHPLQENAEAQIILSEEYGFSLYWAWGTFFRGWALAEQGHVQEGLSDMREGLAALQADVRYSMFLSHYLSLVADRLGKAGHLQDGWRAVARASEMVAQTGERLCEAELSRLRGDLTLQSTGLSPEDRVTKAETCFQHALEVARQQDAKSWELRAATSLARLWQQQGKTTEARDLLAPVYNWFTEGFDTADLQEAKTLLEELSQDD